MNKICKPLSKKHNKRNHKVKEIRLNNENKDTLKRNSSWVKEYLTFKVDVQEKKSRGRPFDEK